MCYDVVDAVRSDSLKVKLRAYFEHQPTLDDGLVTHLTFTREAEEEEEKLPVEVSCHGNTLVRRVMLA